MIYAFGYDTTSIYLFTVYLMFLYWPLVFLMIYHEIYIFLLCNIFYFIEPFGYRIRSTKQSLFDISGNYEQIEDAKQFILMGHPHGLFTSAGALFAAHHSFPINTILLIDFKLYFSSPFIPWLIYWLTGLKISYLKHKNIEKLLADGNNILLFPGGFAEGVGFCDDYRFVSLHMYTYWKWISQKWNIPLFSCIIEDGDVRYFGQYGLCIDLRVHIAKEYHIPLVLLNSVRIPKLTQIISIRFYRIDSDSSIESIAKIYNNDVANIKYILY